MRVTMQLLYCIVSLLYSLTLLLPLTIRQAAVATFTVVYDGHAGNDVAAFVTYYILSLLLPITIRQAAVATCSV